MTTMTCDDVMDRLDARADGGLAGPERAALEAHLAACADCREAADSMDELLRQAAALPAELAPARDLWPGIASRLTVPGGEARRGWTIRPLWVAAAAAALVAASSAATWMLVRPGAPAPGVALATPVPAPEENPATQGPLPVSQGTDEAMYLAATEELMDALEARRPMLAPETRAVVDRNLAVIDGAIGEIRAALRRDPGNAELGRRLDDVHRRKIEVLQRVVRLSS
jgi:anti-sigma factor RsiW